jgi:hypothetical protein
MINWGVEVIGRHALLQWWRDDKNVILGARPSTANSSLPLAVGFALTLISFLVLQTLLIAVAFGTADYDRGRPGVNATGFALASAGIVALACGLGALVSAAQLRRADVDQRGARRVAGLAPAVVLIGIAINGLAADSSPGAVLLIGISGGLAILLEARLGSKRRDVR